ncbi:MAG: hypothetical protein HYX72_10155 [Acidobacteria bacterium]|nr:hypothetical protein [Acidobacteriota bacterium]
MSTGVAILECPKCGRKNRISRPSGGAYRCGSCKENLWVSGQAPLDFSPTGNPDMTQNIDCEYVDMKEETVDVGATTSIRRKAGSLLCSITPRISPRFVVFVLSLASFFGTTVSGRFLWGTIFYFVTGILWFAHVMTLPALYGPLD